MTQSPESTLTSDSSRDPIGEARNRIRRGQILQAAAEVFAETGFHRARTKSIAKRAGVSEGTIYNYFENKDALLLAILDGLNETEERSRAFERAREQEFEEFVRSYLVERLAKVEPHLETLRPILSEVLVNGELRDRYREATLEPTFRVAQEYLSEQGSSESDSVLTSRAIAAQVLGLIVLRLLGDEVLRDRWDELPPLLAGLIADGMKGEGGR